MSNQQQVGMMKGMERAFDVVKEITKSPTGILGSELKNCKSYMIVVSLRMKYSTLKSRR
jgi:hypothetical protein